VSLISYLSGDALYIVWRVSIQHWPGKIMSDKRTENEEIMGLARGIGGLLSMWWTGVTLYMGGTGLVWTGWDSVIIYEAWLFGLGWDWLLRISGGTGLLRTEVGLGSLSGVRLGY
jgi:hypothetical protein